MSDVLHKATQKPGRSLYNTMYFDRNIDLSEKISMAKKSADNYSLYCNQR